jgi:hypothetical protein
VSTEQRVADLELVVATSRALIASADPERSLPAWVSAVRQELGADAVLLAAQRREGVVFTSATVGRAPAPLALRAGAVLAGTDLWSLVGDEPRPLVAALQPADGPARMALAAAVPAAAAAGVRAEVGRRLGVLLDHLSDALTEPVASAIGHRDETTGCLRADAFQRELEGIVGDSAEAAEVLVALVLDDADVAIREVAGKRLRRSLRDGDLAAVWRPDTFVLVLRDLVEADQATAVVARLVAALFEPVATPCGPARIGVRAALARRSELETAPEWLHRVLRAGIDAPAGRIVVSDPDGW